jgi:hypothetical protein
LHVDEGDAAFDVDQGAIPRVAEAARGHAVPIADLDRRVDALERIEGEIERRRRQAEIADFAFRADYPGRADRLPVAPERAAAEEAALQVVIPRIVGARSQEIVAVDVRGAYGFRVPGAADVAADIAAGPVVDRGNDRPRRQGPKVGGRRNAGEAKNRDCCEQDLFPNSPSIRVSNSKSQGRTLRIFAPGKVANWPHALDNFVCSGGVRSKIPDIPANSFAGCLVFEHDF